MYIHEMSETECRIALARSGFGRLGCARDNQPYVVPIYYVYDDDHLYGFTTLGQKVDWMRLNSNVCLEIDERISHDQWMSVIVFGRYEELPDTPENEAIRARAQELLQKRVMWWEPAFVGLENRDMPHSVTPVCYRIHINGVSGKRATPEAYGRLHPEARKGAAWFDRLLQRIGVKAKGDGRNDERPTSLA
jgi:nitroimidazol reductase NimA-like FMN-containing flavoprotein (pyridoxamine 5'-phosphate oxidase superfamily)